jgi:hypothetical protein
MRFACRRSWAVAGIIPLVLTAAALGFGGCRPRAGVVIGKEHVPASCTVEIAPMLLAGRHEVQRGRVPLLRVTPEQYLIQVKRGDSVELYDLRSKAVFDVLSIGNLYEYDAATAQPAPGTASCRLTPDEFDRVLAAEGDFEAPATAPAGGTP